MTWSQTFDGVIGDRHERRALDAGVVDGEVQPLPAADRRLKQRLHLLRHGDVGLDKMGFAALLLDQAHSLLAFSDAPGAQGHARSLGREGQSRRAPDPGASARDQYHLAFERPAFKCFAHDYSGAKPGND